MKRFKKITIALLILTVVLVVFRGWIYRNSITYHSMGNRTNYAATDDQLIRYIEENIAGGKEYTIQEIIPLALSLTSRQLHFTAARNHNDPNQLIHNGSAHCVGYAAFFASCCNYLLKKNHLESTWSAQPQIGQLYLWGENIHPYFQSPFFRDHDFVIIQNKTTGETLAVDPTVHDYLRINYVSTSLK